MAAVIAKVAFSKEPPKDPAAFAGPLTTSILDDTPRKYFRTLTIDGAVTEYAWLTGRTNKHSDSLFWLRRKDDLFRKFLRRSGITQRMESLLYTKLPTGNIEFAPTQHTDAPIDIPNKAIRVGVSLKPAEDNIRQVASNRAGPIYDQPDIFINETPTARVFNLWLELRNKGVELCPAGEHELRAVWHQKIQSGK